VPALRPGKPGTGRSGRDASLRQVPSGAAVDRWRRRHDLRWGRRGRQDSRHRRLVGTLVRTQLPRWLGPGLAGYRPADGRPRPARDPASPHSPV